jgi:hypothetical protein
LDSPLTIFGYPPLAFFFFIVAACISLWLVVKSAFMDE